MLLWIVGGVVVLAVVLAVARQCAIQEHPDFDILSYNIEFAKIQLEQADVYGESGCQANTSLWVERKAAGYTLDAVDAMVRLRPGVGTTGEYGRWLADHVLSASDRATIVGEQIVYACLDSEKISDDVVVPSVAVDPPSNILAKGVVFECQRLRKAFDEVEQLGTDAAHTYVGNVMTQFTDELGRYADFDSYDAKIALAECGQ